MPNRILRDGILDSEAVNGLSEQGEIFYRRLMSIVDDYGRFEANPVVLRARLFAMQLDRWPLSRVSEALSEVSRLTVNEEHLVIVYEVGNKKYLEIQRFKQRVRSPSSKYPGVDDGHVTVAGQTDDGPPRASRARTSSSSSPTPTSTPIEFPPQNKKSADQVNWPDGWQFEVWFQGRIEKHPIPGRPQIAQAYALEKVWVAFKPDEFDAIHDAWCAYWRGKDGGIPNLATFIFEEYWKRAPPEQASKSDQRVARYLQRKREEENGDHDAA